MHGAQYEKTMVIRIKKTNAAMRTVENAAESAFRHVVSAEDVIYRITGAVHREPKRRMTTQGNPLFWTVIRTVS